MAQGISKTQLVLLRGSLRSLVLFGPLYVLVRVLTMRDNGSLTWWTWLGGSRYDGRLPIAEGAHVEDAGIVPIRLEDPGTEVWIATLAPTVIIGLAVSVVGFVLLGILHETYAGQPFFDSSSRRLRLVSRVIAVVAVTVPVARSIANVEVADQAVPSLDVPGDIDVSTMLLWLLVALVVRVIAEAFRIGTELRRETEGLV
jgi:hypothetical protein